MTLTPAALRSDAPGRACGQSHIAQGKTCHQKGAFPTGKAIAAGITAGAVGAALLHKGSRRAVQQGITKAVHKITAPAPSMRLTPKAFEQIKPTSKTERLHLEARAANQEAERAIKKAAQSEVERALAVGEAMHKAGKATRASLRSGIRRHNLTVEKLRRRYEPGFRRTDNYIQHYATTYIDPARKMG